MNLRVRARDLRIQAELAETEDSGAKFRSAAEDWERMAEAAEKVDNLRSASPIRN